MICNRFAVDLSTLNEPALVNRNFCCIFVIPHPLYVVVSGDRFICAVRSAAIWKTK
jgi:hypothetical protein